jgi:predicted nucleic acid-binding protein
MIVVSDTTPIISLIKIGKLNILQQLFGNVQIPEAVFKELTSNALFKDEAQEVISCDFIERIPVENVKSVDELRRSTNLDAGESEAIVLADSIDNSVLLIDEAKGRKVAKNMGLNIMGTIGILLTAYEEGCINSEDVENSIEVIRNSKLRISENLIDYLHDKISE